MSIEQPLLSPSRERSHDQRGCTESVGGNNHPHDLFEESLRNHCLLRSMKLGQAVRRIARKDPG